MKLFRFLRTTIESMRSIPSDSTQQAPAAKHSSGMNWKEK